VAPTHAFILPSKPFYDEEGYSSSFKVRPGKCGSEDKLRARHASQHTELISQRFQLLQIGLVLLLALHFLLDTLEDSDCGSVVVDTSGGSYGSLDNTGRGDQVMCKTVVQATLNLKKVLSVFEEVDVPFRKGLEGLLGVARRTTDETGGSAGGAGSESWAGCSTEDGGDELGTHGWRSV
jgi:hypothetical protein